MQVAFPQNLAFGVVPLRVPASRKIKLKGSPTGDLPFEIEIVQPHPYFRVDPCIGILPANGSVAITVTYNPITFGSNAMVLRLSIKLMGYTPKDCVISARAISGLIEQQELKKSIKRVEEHKSKLSGDINNNLSASGTMFCGKRDILSNSATWKTISASMERVNDIDDNHSTKEVIVSPSPSKVPAINHPVFESDLELESEYKAQSRFRNEQLKRHDPISTLLASTFHASNTNVVLDNSIAKLNGNTSNRRLSKKDKDEMASLGLSVNVDGNIRTRTGVGTNANIHPSRLLSSKMLLPNGSRVLQGQIKAKPRGPGSGAVFDAGAEWMSHQFKQKHERRMKQKRSETELQEQNSY